MAGGNIHVVDAEAADDESADGVADGHQHDGHPGGGHLADAEERRGELILPAP